MKYIFLFSIHPLLQTVAIVFCLSAFYLGCRRALGNHLGLGITFPWKKHVIAGGVSLLLLLVGFGGGLSLTVRSFAVAGTTGIHYSVALVLLPFLLFCLCSGLCMDKVKKRRSVLNCCHGLCNTVVVFLVIWQLITGARLWRLFVLGY